MKLNLNDLTRRFLLDEGTVKPSVRAYVESVIRILDEVRPKSQKENRQISVAKQHLHEIKRLNRKLEERITLLEEQVKILEEGTIV
ncbi:MAG: hypothetical protein GOVbin630_124 [Prokaryotic dsDNA virus sp.]|nr:MAG: hypothetical protein GOVbin630_124 [Prokaryotic dsDNA virus sp.]|tara:strand:- start:1991 stop:2248 length:258 start_codon:yes stop_codon:yes gene_type:complete